MKIIYVNRYFLRYALPLVIIVTLFLSGVYFLGEKSDSLQETILRIGHGFIMTAGLWTGCILIVDFLWRKYPWQDKPVKHLLYEIFLIFFYTIAFSFLVYFAETKLFDIKVDVNIIFDAFTTLLITFFITAIHEALFFYRQWKLHFSKSIKLQKENIEANYEALKNQVNPHFLFNSLNSLSGMVDDNPEAVAYIKNLSDFLRYLLTSNNKELGRLSEETEIAEKYLEIQKTRFGNALHVSINIEKTDANWHLPPLVIQMLVENCIKHNVISLETPLKIKIYTDEDSLLVENNLNPKIGIISTKQGLKNIRNRYSLFTGKTVDVMHEDNVFRVKVPLLKVE